MYGWAWLWLLILLLAAFPWACWFARGGSDRLLIALLVLAMSFGGLSLIAFWIGWLGTPITWRTVTLIYLVFCAFGWLFWRRSVRTALSGRSIRAPVNPNRQDWLARLALIVIGIMAALILFNALYWPIGVDDALVIYGYFGKLIATSGQLPALHPRALYETYPMALPLIEALCFQASGWFDSHLAALFPALLSIGTLGVAYLIGRTLYNRTVGLIAALLIALTPSIVYWASASYTDLPAGFFYGMAWLFVIRYGKDRHVTDAILCGIMAGLSAWTKNSGLLIVGSIGLWILTSPSVFSAGFTSPPDPLSVNGEGEKRASFTLSWTRKVIGDGLLIGVPFLVICGPWYARNLILAGWLIPPTGWTFAAQPTIGNLFPYLTDSRYWPSGIIFTIGLLWLIGQLIRSRGKSETPAVLLIGYLPFFVIWWLLFSYEDRFLLVLTPLIAVMGSASIQAIMTRITWPRESILRLIRLSAAILIILCVILAGSAAVLFKNELIRQPLMGEIAKQQVRFGGRYAIGLYLQAHSDGCTFTSDPLMFYLAFPTPILVGDVPQSAAGIAGCHYLMLRGDQMLPAAFGSLAPITTDGQYRLYTVP